MAATRVKWHGQDLPVVREIVRIGGVETAVEIPELAEPELRQIVALLTAFDRFEAAVSIALLELTAGLYIKHGGTPEKWRAYVASLGVPKSKTRQPASIFQPFLRWAKGGRPDTTSLLSKLASTLDDWLELGDKRPSPITDALGTSELAEWLAASGGYTNIAERRRERFDSASQHAQIYSESEYEDILASDHDEPAWLTPPEFLAELDREFNFTKGFDPCPYPRPKGFDGLKVPWPESTYCNPPFRKQDGIGIAAFARKAIEENKLGKTVVLVLPTFGTINCLLEAGAELRSARRIPWIDPRTGQPATTSPSSNMLAILRGKAHSKKNGIAELKARISALEAENVALKARIKELTGKVVVPMRLGGDGS